MKYVAAFLVFGIALTFNNVEMKTIDMESKELVNINGTIFYISANGVYFNVFEGLKLCNDINFKLISIETEEKQNIIQQYLEQNSYQTRSFWTSGVRYYNTMLLWTGSGNMFTYTHWDIDQPDLSFQTPDICVYLTGTGMWRDAECVEEHSVICEQVI